MKIAVLQMPVTRDKKLDLDTAARYTAEAASAGAKLAVLPEMFCCPYDNAQFPRYAEEAGGDIWSSLSRTAKENSIFLVGGSFPELENGKLYNSCFIFDDRGRQLAKHRKVHMFDINVNGGQCFRESDTLTAGCESVVFEVLGHRFGIAICFDIRFPEFFRTLALKGAEAIIVPAAFNRTTGPMHWELLFRSRAVDDQVYTIGAAPARVESEGYVSYGHSIVCDPWGRVLADAGEKPGILYCELDFDEVRSVRNQLPFLSARRPEVYEL